MARMQAKPPLPTTAVDVFLYQYPSSTMFIYLSSLAIGMLLSSVSS